MKKEVIMKIKKSVSLVSMLSGISALFFYPGIIVIEVLCKIESFPLNYNIIVSAALICALLGIGFGVISKNELCITRKSNVMSIIGIVCSYIMIMLLSIAAVFVLLEELNIFKLF